MSALEVFHFADFGSMTHRIEVLGAAPLAGVEKHVYAIEVGSAGVKVGITEQPRKRIQAHARAARAHGHELGRIAVTEARENARANERELIALGGDGNRSEYLTLDFDDVLAVMRSLVIERADAEWHAARAEGVKNLFANLLFGGAR
ncbi:hypothetical protein [Microbacterium oxydans]|uniref:hypothetical protein n=1 Tax=Microbacterium oxydans TaxID=82380 RepID=UPI00366EBBB7